MTSNLVIDALRMTWFKRHLDKQAGVLCHNDSKNINASFFWAF